MPTPRKAPPPTINSAMVAKTTGFKSQKKKPNFARARPILSNIYGEKLFLTNLKKEKEIVIEFYKFTSNGLRISICGNYIIESPLGLKQGIWNLFYFPNPIKDFDPTKDCGDCKEGFLLEGDTKIQCSSCMGSGKKNIYHIPQDSPRIPYQINHSIDLQDVVEIVMKTRRAEFLVEREKRKEELKQQDVKDQEKLDEIREMIDKEEEEKEKEIKKIEFISPEKEKPNVVEQRVQTEPTKPSPTKISIGRKIILKKEEILQEIKKEEISQENKPEPKRFGTGIFAKKVQN